MPVGKLPGAVTVTAGAPLGIFTDTATCEGLPLYTKTWLGTLIEKPDCVLVGVPLLALAEKLPPNPLAEKTTCVPTNPLFSVTEKVSDVAPLTAARTEAAETPAVVPGTTAT